MWLDASTVYGSDYATSVSVRNSSNGLLLTSTDGTGRQLLPITSGTNCFLGFGTCLLAGTVFLLQLTRFSSLTVIIQPISGDARNSEQPQLAVMHTVWLREHNRAAAHLTKLNNYGWTRETIFQEARRIVIAEYQHITYNEFLPTLGILNFDSFKLNF